MAIASDMQRRFRRMLRAGGFALLAGAGIGVQAASQELDRVVAIVDDDIVTATELLDPTRP